MVPEYFLFDLEKRALTVDVRRFFSGTESVAVTMWAEAWLLTGHYHFYLPINIWFTVQIWFLSKMNVYQTDYKPYETYCNSRGNSPSDESLLMTCPNLNTLVILTYIISSLPKLLQLIWPRGFFCHQELRHQFPDTFFYFTDKWLT